MERLKEEPRGSSGERTDKASNPQPDAASMLAMDYNKLYGDLYRKLITTPVGDIFPQFSAASATTSGTPDTTTSIAMSSPLAAGYHPAFSLFGASGFPANGASGMGLLPGMTGAGAVSPEANLGQKDVASMFMDPTQTQVQDIIDAKIYAEQSKGIEDMDLEQLVERFRDTLEKFGVSQRFAARVIMRDTSQGNLSFLMEKGRNRKWAELSPRGRVPYLRMKTWLESGDQQQHTLRMLKQSQDQKRASPRESYSRRERFSMFQINVLCRLFEENPNPPMNVRNAVAERLNIPLDRVNVWFQNQRARGFPARKFLDQAFNDDTPNASPTPSSVDNRRKSAGRRRSGDVCQDISNGNKRSHDFDNQLFQRGIPNDTSALLAAHEQARKLTGPTKLDWSMMSPDSDLQQPLDFSAKSLASPPATATASGVLTTPSSDELGVAGTPGAIGALSDIVQNMTPVQDTPSQMKLPVTQSSSTPEPPRHHGIGVKSTSGAAKRKRGLKPQQIIYRSDTEEVNFETGSVQVNDKEVARFGENDRGSPKRMKMDASDNIAESFTKADQLASQYTTSLSSESTPCNVAQDSVSDTSNTGDKHDSKVTINMKQVNGENGENGVAREKENCQFELGEINRGSTKALKKQKSSSEGGTILSAEETLAIMQTLYKKNLLEKTPTGDVAEPDLD